MKATLFLIHGMWCGPWSWANYRQFFEDRGYRCVVPALPYHGTNPEGVPDASLGTTSVLDYVDALEREIRQLPEMPILIGHSMGGLLTQMLASRGMARAAVLLAPSAPAGIIMGRPSVIRSFWSIHQTWRFWRKPVRQTFAEAVYSMLHRVPADRRRAIYDQLVFESGRTVFEIGHWYLDSKGVTRVDESSVTCPVLIVTGSEDRISVPSVVRRIAKKYGDVVSYKEFDNHAHWLMGEPGWEEVAGYVSDWLETMLHQ